MIVLSRGAYYRKPCCQRFRSHHGWAVHVSYKTLQLCVGSKAVVRRATSV